MPAVRMIRKKFRAADADVFGNETIYQTRGQAPFRPSNGPVIGGGDDGRARTVSGKFLRFSVFTIDCFGEVRKIEGGRGE